jgi:hypothetical protein
MMLFIERRVEDIVAWMDTIESSSCNVKFGLARSISEKSTVAKICSY